jgi:hypothetical protein
MHPAILNNLLVSLCDLLIFFGFSPRLRVSAVKLVLDFLRVFVSEPALEQSEGW